MEIAINQVYKSFLLNGEKIPVLDNISLTVPHGQCTALLGPSGCGKSTLLSMIAGFYPPDSGSITTTGKVSLCMQKDMLLPWRDLLAKTKPEVIDSLNNGQGTFLYNHNIKEVKVIADKEGGIEITTDAERATGTMFQYDSVRVEYPKTADNIFSTLLTARYPAKTESKLVNEYQSAMLGLLAESAKSPYENFLKDRLAIREMVDADCETYNIPMDL